MPKLSQENIVLILVGLILIAALWWVTSPAMQTASPTPEAPIPPDPNASYAAMPWYFGNQVFMQGAPLPAILPRMTVGNGAGGDAPNMRMFSSCRTCSGIAPGIRG